MQHSILLWLSAFAIYVFKEPIQQELLFEVIAEKKKRENNTQNTSEKISKAKVLIRLKLIKSFYCGLWYTVSPADLL